MYNTTYWKANHTAWLGSKLTCVMNEDVEQSLAVLSSEGPQGKPLCASNDIGMLWCPGVVTLTWFACYYPINQTAVLRMHQATTWLALTRAVLCNTEPSILLRYFHSSWDLKLSRLWISRLRSTGMWRCVVWKMGVLRPSASGRCTLLW